MKKIVFIVCILLMQFVPIHAFEQLQLPEDETVILTVTPKDFSMEQYTSQQLSVSVNIPDSNPHIIYEVEDSTIVSVNEDGYVSALKPGNTKIGVSATLNGVKYEESVSITVYPIASDITFTDSEIKLTRGDIFTLDYQTSNPNIQSKDIIWSSSNSSVATVANGVVTTLTIGKAVITARIGEASASMNIIVEVPLQRIEFNPNRLVVHEGNAVKLPSLIYVPYDSTVVRDVVFSSSDNSIATVENGQIIPKKLGEVTITATLGDIEAFLNVEVKPRENEYGASLVTFELKEKHESKVVMALYYNFPNDDTLFALTLPSVETLDALSNNKRIELIIPSLLINNNFKLIERITVPEDVMQAIGQNPLVIDLYNSQKQLVGSYTFVNPTPYSMNLKFMVNKLSEDSEIARTIDGPAFEIRFNQPLFPSGTRFSLPFVSIESHKNAMHFLYKVEDQTRFDVQSFVQSDKDEAIGMTIDTNRYVITFNAVSQSKDLVAIWVLLTIIVCVFIGWIAFLTRNRGKK